MGNQLYKVKLSEKAEKIYYQIDREDTKLGELRKIAKDIKKDHELSTQLWSTGSFFPRQLAILIMDKNSITQQFIDKIDQDLQKHDIGERTQLIDWFMANQLLKDKKKLALIESWENNPSSMKRRIFWYYQARLRWMGHTHHTNTEELLTAIENNIVEEQPEVQWAMNYTAGQIGKWQEEYRSRCIAIGIKTGLYKDEIVPKNCTPSYLPEFIRIEAAKVANQKTKSN